VDLGGLVGRLEACFGASIATAGGGNKGSLAVFGGSTAATSLCLVELGLGDAAARKSSVFETRR